ncbi:MAG: heavy metal translocating P-type ATPase [Promethearchaeota archaeon]
MTNNGLKETSCGCSSCGKFEDICELDEAQHDHGGNHEHARGDGDGGQSVFSRHFWKFLSVAAASLVMALLSEFIWSNGILLTVFAANTVVFIGHDVFLAAFSELKERRLGASTLMVVAAIGSFFIRHGNEGAMAIFLYSLAEKLEDLSADKARDAVAKLLRLSPDHALLNVDGRLVEVETGTVKVGQVIVVKPGAKVPLDGLIISGTSYFDTHSITGESIPKLREEGDKVYASSINGDSLVEIEVTAESGSTLLARITKSIKQARKNKSSTEKFIDKFARFYTPIIFIASILTMVVPPLILGTPWDQSIYRGFILLVISCPCALTLASPLSMVAALTKLSREGILVKGGKYIEELAGVKMFGFDKTATITEGRLKIHDNVPLKDGWTATENLRIIASLEVNSSHPIAKAIMNGVENVKLIPVTGFTEIKGKGVTAKIGSDTYVVGSVHYFEEQGILLPMQRIAEFAFLGKTPVLLSRNGELLGMVTIRDNLRVSAPVLTRGLKHRGIKSMIISGDNQATVDSIADCLFIDKRFGNLLPQDKLEKIKEMQESGFKVAMVGDGINDAPALTQANIGIAMGTSGTDIAIESADVTIMNDDLTKILVLMDVQKRTNRIVRQNIWLSITLKLTFAVLTVLGYMSLALAVGVGDMGLSLVVILNGFRVFSYKSKFQQVSTEDLEIQATKIICSTCKTVETYPQHHGREMIPRDGELVCWRSLVAEVSPDVCKARLSLVCNSCNGTKEVVY